MRKVAKGSADIVLLNDDFTTIVGAVEEGRRTYANIQTFLIYYLTCQRDWVGVDGAVIISTVRSRKDDYAVELVQSLEPSKSKCSVVVVVSTHFDIITSHCSFGKLWESQKPCKTRRQCTFILSLGKIDAGRDRTKPNVDWPEAKMCTHGSTSGPAH